MRYDYQKTAAGLAVFIIGLIYLAGRYDYGMNPLDEGYFVMSSLRVLHGQVPYIDFQNNYAPGRFYFFAALAGLFGEDFLVFRAGWVVLFAVYGVLVYLSLKERAGIAPAVFMSLALVFMLCPWHKGFFVIMPVLCILAFGRHFDGPGVRRAAAAGAVTALALFFRQDIGVYAFASFSVTSLIMYLAGGRNRRDLAFMASYAAAFVLACLPVVLYYALRHSLVVMLEQMFLAGARDVSASWIPFPPASVLTGSNGAFRAFEGWLYYLPLGIYAASAVKLAYDALRRRIGAGYYTLMSLTLLAALTYVQLLNRTDLPHVWQILPPAYILLAVLLAYSRPSGGGRYLKLGPVSALVIAAAAAGYVSAYLSPWNPQVPHYAVPDRSFVRLGLENADVMVTPDYAETYLGTKEFLDANTKPGEKVIAIPDIPIVYFISGRENPLRYDLLRPGIADEPGLQREIVAGLKSQYVPYMVFNEKEMSDGRPERLFRNRSPIIYGYLMENYTRVGVAGNYSIWRLNSAAPSGV